MTDNTHELMKRELDRLQKKLTALEVEIWSWKDAFYWHTHEEDPDLKDAADALNQRANS